MVYDVSEVDKKNAQAILDAINNMGGQKGIAQVLAVAHPTLQQSFMRLAIYFIDEMSKKTYTDARNDASALLAKRLIAVLKKDGEWVFGLPFI